MPGPNYPPQPAGFSAQQSRRSRTLALRIALGYFVVAVTWILVSDQLLQTLVSAWLDPSLSVEMRELRHSQAQTLKGWFYITVTAVALFYLVRSFIRSVQKTENIGRLEVSRAADEFRFLFDDNPLPLLVYDPATLRILKVNNAAVAKYGYGRAEWFTLAITALHSSAHSLEFPALLSGFKDEPVSHNIARHRKKDGTFIDVHVGGRPTTFEGRPARLIVIFDITERVATQKALEQYRLELEHRVHLRTQELTSANQRLQSEVSHCLATEEQLRIAKRLTDDANQAKTAFVTNTVHELRTPLTSILGYAELLRDEPATPDVRRQHADVIYQSSLQLMTLIDELLDMARIEAGRINITPGEFDIRQLLPYIVNLLQPRAAEKQLELLLQIDDHVPPTLYTDQARLRQILLNLLSNAIKFTSRGSVTLRVKSHVDSLHFQVLDTGIGIDPDHLPHLFEPFFQVENANDQNIRGTGLGLSISHELAEKLGGFLHAESTPGKGSTFTLTLPSTLAPVAQAAPLAPTLAFRILLAEDDANVRWLVEEYLRRAGTAVVSATHASQAIDIFDAAQDPQNPFNLIILDISMPGMDGTDCATVLRSRGYRGPLVALTARTDAEQTRRCQIAGFNAVLPKPIDTRTFIRTLAALAAPRKK